MSNSITEQEIEWIDGFLLGDGFINYNKKDNTFKSARFVIASTQKQWADFGISGLNKYKISKPKQYGKINKKNPNLSWTCRTLTHNDIIEQAKRWYPNFKKNIPNDIRITPISLLLWYS